MRKKSLSNSTNALCDIRMASSDRRVYHRLSCNVEDVAKTSHQVFCTPLAVIAGDEVPHLIESSVKTNYELK